MAFKDIFEEQRKKLNNYFGLGQPGLGTFGKQVSNVIKPTVSKNIQNYQKAGRYLSSQPTLAQRFTPVVGPARSLVNLRRDLRNPQSYPRQMIAGAGRTLGDTANLAQKINIPTQIANRVLPQQMTPKYNIQKFRNLAYRQPKATTIEGKIGSFIGENAPYFAIPGGGTANYGSKAFQGLSKTTPNILRKAVLTNAAKIAGRKELLANIGREAIQGAGFMGATSVGQDKSPKEIAKDILVGAGFGAGARLGMAGAGAVVGKVADKVKLQQAINSIKNPELRLQVNKEIGLLQSKPAFAKLPINPKKPSQPIVGANKGIDALRGEARRAGEEPVYHGTRYDFNNFSSSELGKNTKAGSAKEGFFFTNKKSIAEGYAEGNMPKIDELESKMNNLENIAQKTGKQSDWDAYEKAMADYENASLSAENKSFKGTTKQVYLDMKNPYIKDMGGKAYDEKELSNLVKKAKSEGYDGIVLKNAADSVNTPIGSGVRPENELSDIKVVFSESQIKDKPIINQSLSTNKGAVTPLKVNKPQKGIRLPLKGEKATEGLVTSVPPAGKGIERGFSKTIKTAQGLPDEIQNLKSTYIPITNKATLKAAKTQLDVEKFVKSNYDQAKKRVLSGEMTAENNALGQELIRRNIDAGKFDEVDEIFNKMAEKGTSAGQYNQAFAMWSKTTPEGMLKYAKSTVDKANSQLGSVSKALRGVFGKQMPKIDEADAKFITSQMKKAQGLPEAQRIPLIQSVMDRINKKIPWGVSDVIDTYRYNNMLSNPLTHLRNAVSNLQQTFITRPATLLGQGKVKDAVKYEIGTLKALPDAVDGFVKAMKKPGQLGRLDEPMRLKPRLLGRWNTPSDLMEAGDVFFRKLIESGEKSRGTTAKEASEIAEYSLFRAPLNAKQQGVLLNKIDDVTKATYNLRKVGLGWFIPFIRTPMNVAKQWIEYSPAGFSTMVGAGNKGEQAAKATVGSLITLAGANLALQGRTTWDAPVDPKEKELFYASGRKPFSVKVGDKWVPMQTFGAFAFALGLPAAAKYYQTESRTALTDDDISKWTKIATSGLNFWSGQTFVQGLGNFVDLVQGDQDWKLSRLLAQPITQLKPMTGALSYIARLTDPVFRKASGFGDQLKQGVPGLTKGMKAYTNPLGEESRRNITDFVAPYSMGQEDTRFEQPYKERQKTLQENNLINQLKKQGKSGTAPSGRTVVQIGNEFKEFDTEQEANFAIAKEDFKKSGKNIQQYEDKVFRLQSDGDVKVQDKIDYDYSLNTNKLQRLKSSKDYKGWVETANKQLEILDKQLKDPTLDELEQSDLLEKADKILSDMAKYSEYGGFDKPKKGKKINISVPDLGSAKIPVKRAGKFAFKTSSAPKINIVSTKPKQITKSYLASIR